MKPQGYTGLAAHALRLSGAEFGRLEKIFTQQHEDLLKSAVSKLSDSQQQILRERFGLNHPQLTLEQLAPLYGVTGSRVRMLENEASKALRSPLYFYEFEKAISEAGLGTKMPDEIYDPQHLHVIRKKLSNSVLLGKVDLQGVSIKLLMFTTRTGNCLEYNEIVNLWELTQCTQASLLRIPSFGRSCLREVEEKLAELGLKLAK